MHPIVHSSALIREWLLGAPEFARGIGLATQDGAIFKAKHAKFEEIVSLTEHVLAVTRNISPRRPAVILDLACGRSYASFAIYYVLDRVAKRPVKIVGVDSNERLIERCRATAARAGMDMEFYACPCLEFRMSDRPDVAISLHACDTASDEALAAAIRLKSRNIIVAPCCHRQVKRNMDLPLLKGLTQFSVCKERLAEMATDAMRALLVRTAGYEVELIEFVPTSVTPKNLMIRAKWRNLPDPAARVQYTELSSAIGAAPLLERLLA